MAPLLTALGRVGRDHTSGATWQGPARSSYWPCRRVGQRPTPGTEGAALRRSSGDGSESDGNRS